MRFLPALLLMLAATPAVAEPEPRGFVDGDVTLGAMVDAPETIAGVIGVGVRGGWWIPGSRIGLELTVDAAKLASPDPEGFDESHWSGTFISRVRALAGVRFGGDPALRQVYFARLAVGVERVAIATTTWTDQSETRERVSDADVAPAAELSGGLLVGRANPSGGVELALSRVAHDGAYFEGFQLGYVAYAVELRLLLGFDL